MDSEKYVQIIKKFYSSPEYEKKLQEKYEFELKKKQDEIDEVQRRTKKIQKFTAKAHILRPERLFIVCGGKIYCGDQDDNILSPEKLVEGGVEYILDTEGDNIPNIQEFVSTWPCYKVFFNPDGKYGPCTQYCTNIGATPARLESFGGYKLFLDDDDKYDLVCG
jgi:hypothetical protein